MRCGIREGMMGFGLLLVAAMCGAQSLPGGRSSIPLAPAPASWRARSKAAIGGARSAERAAWSCLNKGLAAKNFDLRAEAIAALGAVGTRPDVVRLIENGLEDSSPVVREAAAATLGKMKSRASIPRLRAALDDKSPVVSFTAAEALWGMGDQSGEPILVAVLDGERKAAPGAIREGLTDIHQELHDPKALAELGATQAAGAFLGPAGLGFAAITTLAKDKSAPARAASAQLLGESTAPEARDALFRALRDNSWIVRAAAAQALGAAGLPGDVGGLERLLRDDHAVVRYNAGAAILRLVARQARKHR
jgi:HEAT repeat protein